MHARLLLGVSKVAPLPPISTKLVHRHRLARAPAPRAAHREPELGGKAARRFVLSVLDDELSDRRQAERTA
jgi:hypothetical protein